MPFDGQHHAGGMGEPLMVSRDIGHWHVFLRQHARLRARAKTRRDGAECAGRALVAWEAHGHGMRSGCSVYKA